MVGFKAVGPVFYSNLMIQVDLGYSYSFCERATQGPWQLYFSVSLNGVQWHRLNNNEERGFDEYQSCRGFCKAIDAKYDNPDITKDSTRDINFRYTPDCSKVLPVMGQLIIFMMLQHKW